MLSEVTRPGAGEKVVLEVGAGAGNSAFPIVAANENPALRVWACDFSRKAVELLRASEACDGRVLRAEVWDVASATETLPPGLREGSVDVVLMIFVFSALEPGQWAQAVRNVWAALRPGGEVCFRDYGRGDLAQVRFKKGRLMGEGWYVRGDGTRVYFFERGQLGRIWGGARWEGRRVEAGGEEGGGAGGEGGDGGTAKMDAEENVGSRRAEIDGEEREGGGQTEAVEEQCEECQQAEPDEGEREERQESRQAEVDEGKGGRDADGDVGGEGRFEILSLGVDRRLLVNRQRKLKMYRCWMQGRFGKRDEAGKELQESAGVDGAAAAAEECSQENQASSQS